MLQVRGYSVLEGSVLEGKQVEDDQEEENQTEVSDDDINGDCCAKLIETPIWNAAVVTFIMLNTISLAIECNYPEPRESFWLYIELFFLCVFIVEIVIRLFAYGCAFFTGEDKWWNIFDFIIVATGVLDLFLRLFRLGSEKGTLGSEKGTFGHFVTIFRVIRCLRVLRSVRLLKEFKQLNLLTHGFFYAVKAAIWLSVAFSLILLVFAIFTTNLIGHNAEEFGADADYIYAHFGSLRFSFFTMFQIITMDEWSNVVRVVMKQIPWLGPFFMLYIMLMAFTMISLLTGVMAQKITENALEASEADKEETLQNFLRRLEDMFYATNNGAGLRPDQLFQIVFSPEMKKSLRQLHKKNGLSLTSHDISDILQAMNVGANDLMMWSKLEEVLLQFLEAGSAKNLFKMQSDIQRLERVISSMSSGAAASQPCARAPPPVNILWSPVPRSLTMH